jgi:hypothetical protein
LQISARNHFYQCFQELSASLFEFRMCPFRIN